MATAFARRTLTVMAALMVSTWATMEIVIARNHLSWTTTAIVIVLLDQIAMIVHPDFTTITMKANVFVYQEQQTVVHALKTNILRVAGVFAQMTSMSLILPPVNANAGPELPVVTPYVPTECFPIRTVNACAVTKGMKWGLSSVNVRPAAIL